MTLDINQVLRESYFNHFQLFKKHVLNKSGLSNCKLFLVHFDTSIGPVLASSRMDETLLRATKVKLKRDVEMDSFTKAVPDKDFRDAIMRVHDLFIDELDFEVILSRKGVNVFFRFFEVKNKLQVRGKVEHFMLIFIKDELKIESGKFDKAASLMKQILTNYFNRD